MINILDRYKEDESFIQCFETMETDIIEAIRLADITKSIVVIKKSLLSRFKKVDKTLDNKYIYTFKNDLSEIFDPAHPINDTITEKIINMIKDRMYLLSNTESLITILSFREMRDFSIQPEKFYEEPMIQKPILTGVLQGYHHASKENCAEVVCHRTQQLIQEQGLNTTTYDIYQHYMLEISRTKATATSIGHKFVKQHFEKNLRLAVNTIINLNDNDYDDFDFNNYDVVASDFEHLENNTLSTLYGILTHIAEMDKRQLHLFAHNHYTFIPYMQELESPKTIIKIRVDAQNHVYIKGKNGITQLSYPEYRSSNGEYELIHYPYSTDNITLLGYEFELTPDVFEGANLEVFNMVAYQNHNVTVIQNPVIDYESLRLRALKSGSNNDELMNYLHDRIGMYKRKDNRRIK